MTDLHGGQRTEWMTDRLNDLDKRPTDLGRAIGSRRPATAYEILNGKRKIAVEELPAVAHVLEMPITELVYRLCGMRDGSCQFDTEAEAALATILRSLLDKGFASLGADEFVNTALVLYRHALQDADHEFAAPSPKKPTGGNIVDIMKEIKNRGKLRA